jgi:hypothetical protein
MVLRELANMTLSQEKNLVWIPSVAHLGSSSALVKTNEMSQRGNANLRIGPIEGPKGLSRGNTLGHLLGIKDPNTSTR